MTYSPAPSPRRFPSRKSLRQTQAQEQVEQQQPVELPLTTQAVPADLDASPGLLLPSISAPTSSVTPLVPHEPVTEIAAPQSKAPRSRRARFGRTVATASVCGLLLAAVLPVTEQFTTEEPGSAAAAQRLFSTAEAPAGHEGSTISEIDAVVTGNDDPSTYRFDPTVIVNYPFVGSVLLTDVFGYRTAPVAQFHDAQDFAASEGTPIQAIADGVVTEAGFDSDGCGFGLKVEHELDGHTVTSRYCHMQSDSHSLSVGDDIKMGDPVGRVGATGMAFGAHLHLALVLDGEPIDPLPFFTKYTRVKRDIEPQQTPKPVPTEAIEAESD